MSRAAGSDKLAWQEGERGQLSPRPLLRVVPQTTAAPCGLTEEFQSCGYASPPHGRSDPRPFK